VICGFGLNAGEIEIPLNRSINLYLKAGEVQRGFSRRETKTDCQLNEADTCRRYVEPRLINRADQLKRKKQDFFGQYGPESRIILEELLDKYSEHSPIRDARSTEGAAHLRARECGGDNRHLWLGGKA